MALLKKVRSATLIESLVATVLIVIIFIVASLILNNLLLNSFSRNTHTVETRMAELEYFIQHDNLHLPYKEEFGQWKIEIKKQKKGNIIWINGSAINKINDKEVIKNRMHEAY